MSADDAGSAGLPQTAQLPRDGVASTGRRASHTPRRVRRLTTRPERHVPEDRVPEGRVIRPGARFRSGARFADLFERLTTNVFSLYGTAVLRIGYGTAYLVFLLHEYPKHDALWGPTAPWTPALNQQFANDPGLDWFAVDRWWYTFLGHGGKTWFEFWYLAAILVCLLFALGWRTRLTSALFALTIMAFTGRNVFLTDGGDNIMGLMAIYLAFSYCGHRWSLDARRARRRAARSAGVFSAGVFSPPDTPAGRVLAELEDTRTRLVTFMHNAAVLLISAQICVVYAAAGLYKAQGSTWQDGTALYYTMHLDWFRPWPALSDFVASKSVLIAIVAYLTVFVQIAFPFAIFSRWLKYPSLVALIGMHASIGIVLGLPLFSSAMMIGDGVFIPDHVWIRVGALARRQVPPWPGRLPVPRPRIAVAGAPALAGLPGSGIADGGPVVPVAEVDDAGGGVGGIGGGDVFDGAGDDAPLPSGTDSILPIADWQPYGEAAK
jgi:hypothetical protein